MSGDWRGTLWTLLVNFCIVIIRYTETFWSPYIWLATLYYPLSSNNVEWKDYSALATKWFILNTLPVLVSIKWGKPHNKFIMLGMEVWTLIRPLWMQRSSGRFIDTPGLSFLGRFYKNQPREISYDKWMSSKFWRLLCPYRWRTLHTVTFIYNNNYYYYYYYYLLQLSFDSVAVVLTLVQTKQIRINIRKQDNTKHSTNNKKHSKYKYTYYQNNHTIAKTPTHYKTRKYKHPQITKPANTNTHTLQNPHLHTPTH
jgi:hypothetical protein